MTEAILNSMSEGVIALDALLNVIYVNIRFCSIFGIDYNNASSEKKLGNTTFLSFCRSAEMEEAAKQVVFQGKPIEFDMKRYASGVEQHLHVFAAPLDMPEAGNGVVIVVGDQSRLARLEQVRKDFAANVSHELRTPIQVIKGFAENILDCPANDREQIERFAGIILKNVSTMENLTSDLLFLVNLEDEKSPRPPMEEAAIAPLIDEAVGMVQIAAGKKDIEINIFCPPDLKAKIYSSLVMEALVNLLDNGIKYSSAGSRIKVYAYAEKEWLIIEVKDKGMGIPAEHIGRLFERFYRVDRARSRGAGGTGLGLAIVRHIALLHNGIAEAESHSGEGSVFRLKLPLN